MVEKKVTHIPEYKTVQVGTKEKVTYVTSDGKEWDSEKQANKQEEYLTKRREYEAIPLVSTNEDEWYYVDCRNTLDKILDWIGVWATDCTLNNDYTNSKIYFPVWLRVEYVDGGDYRPSAYLTTLDYYQAAYNELMEKIRDATK